MSEADRVHWDARYRDGEVLPPSVAPPSLFAAIEDLFPTSGDALEVACGRGRGATWLARRGMQVLGIDVSPIAIDAAREVAAAAGVAGRCQFAVHDLDHGLPEGAQVQLVLCHLFRDASLDQAMLERLEPGGILAVACLSEVGHGPGQFRASPGELTTAFAGLDVLDAGEADGYAWLVGTT